MWLSESIRRHGVPTLEEPRFRVSVFGIFVLNHTELMSLRFTQTIKKCHHFRRDRDELAAYVLTRVRGMQAYINEEIIVHRFLGLTLFPPAFSSSCLKDRSNYGELVQHLRLLAKLCFYYCASIVSSGLDFVDRC